MNARDLLPFARSNFEAHAFASFQTSYRCAVTLSDGMFLPCVLICEDVDYVNQTLAQAEHGRQQDLTRNSAQPNEQFKRLRNQLTAIYTISPYGIRDVSPSPDAIPYGLIDPDLLFPYESVNLKLTFNDNHQLRLTSHMGCQFLRLPEEYSVADVRSVSRLDVLNVDEDRDVYPTLDCVYFYCFATDWDKQ